MHLRALINLDNPQVLLVNALFQHAIVLAVVAGKRDRDLCGKREDSVSKQR